MSSKLSWIAVPWVGENLICWLKTSRLFCAPDFLVVGPHCGLFPCHPWSDGAARSVCTHPSGRSRWAIQHCITGTPLLKRAGAIHITGNCSVGVFLFRLSMSLWYWALLHLHTLLTQSLPCSFSGLSLHLSQALLTPLLWSPDSPR